MIRHAAGPRLLGCVWEHTGKHEQPQFFIHFKFSDRSFSKNLSASSVAVIILASQARDPGSTPGWRISLRAAARVLAECAQVDM